MTPCKLKRVYAKPNLPQLNTCIGAASLFFITIDLHKTKKIKYNFFNAAKILETLSICWQIVSAPEQRSSASLTISPSLRRFSKIRYRNSSKTVHIQAFQWLSGCILGRIEMKWSWYFIEFRHERSGRNLSFLAV